jgi:hypothetical protein
MKLRLATVALFTAMSLLPLAVSAQNKAPDKMGGAMTYTGCFNKGDAAGQYVLTDDKSGKKIMVTGDDAMLAKHANNHKVTITGTMGKDGNMTVLKATGLKMVAMCK